MFDPQWGRDPQVENHISKAFSPIPFHLLFSDTFINSLEIFIQCILNVFIPQLFPFLHSHPFPPNFEVSGFWFLVLVLYLHRVQFALVTLSLP